MGTALLIYSNLTQRDVSLLLPSAFPPVVTIMMVCSQRILIGGFLFLSFRPLPLQLSEQIRSQQAVSHKATGQRALHRLSQASLSPLTFAASQLITAGTSTDGVPAARFLQGGSDCWVVGSDETCDVLDPLLDDAVKFLLDVSNQRSVWKHVHETVAAETTESSSAMWGGSKVCDVKLQGSIRRKMCEDENPGKAKE